jgi:hypothetical protein
VFMKKFTRQFTRLQAASVLLRPGLIFAILISAALVFVPTAATQERLPDEPAVLYDFMDVVIRGDSGGTGSTAVWKNLRSAETGALQSLLDSAHPGDEIRFDDDPLLIYPISVNSGVPGVKINLNGGTFSGGSPWLTVDDPDITVQGPGTLDGGGSSDPAILVHEGGDNFILQDVEVTGWHDGVQVAGDLTSFKLFGNWFHGNANAGLQVDSGVSLEGVVTVQGNLFKDNSGNGIQNDGDTNPLDASYNSWGHIGGAAAGDGASAAVTTTPYTFSEIYLSVEPPGDSVFKTIAKGSTFVTAVKLDARNLYGFAFQFSYDTTKIVLESDPVFSVPWGGDRCFPLSDPYSGTVSYACNLLNPTPEFNITGGVAVSFEFSATGSGLTGSGPWTAFFDLEHEEPDTSAAAIAGIKVFVNNAGFGDASLPERDITDENDGEVNIQATANYTGFVNLQGYANDAGAVLTVYETAIRAGAIALADGTSSSGGAYTTSYFPPHVLILNNNYYLFFDRALYLPTTPLSSPTFWHSHLLDIWPLTPLNTVFLLGGDAVNDDVIDVLDAGCIGGAYQLPPTDCGGTGSSDVTGDGIMNIQDLTLMGGNYTLTESPWVP